MTSDIHAIHLVLRSESTHYINSLQILLSFKTQKAKRRSQTNQQTKASPPMMLISVLQLRCSSQKMVQFQNVTIHALSTNIMTSLWNMNLCSLVYSTHSLALLLPQWSELVLLYRKDFIGHICMSLYGAVRGSKGREAEKGVFMFSYSTWSHYWLITVITVIRLVYVSVSENKYTNMAHLICKVGTVGLQVLRISFVHFPGVSPINYGPVIFD